MEPLKSKKCSALRGGHVHLLSMAMAPCDVSAGFAVLLANTQSWTVRELAAAACMCKVFNERGDAEGDAVHAVHSQTSRRPKQSTAVSHLQTQYSRPAGSAVHHAVHPPSTSRQPHPPRQPSPQHYAERQPTRRIVRGSAGFDSGLLCRRKSFQKPSSSRLNVHAGSMSLATSKMYVYGRSMRVDKPSRRRLAVQ